MLVSMKEILDRANEENYAVLAPNIFSELDCRAYLEAAEEMNSPIILGVARPTTNDLPMLGKVASLLAEQSRVPVALHLDHGSNISEVTEAIRGGFTSVMLDCSAMEYEDNVSHVREVVELVKPLGISVEAEIGHVGAGQDYENSTGLTDPAEAKQFIEDTGIDACAVSIGTAHGAYKGTPHLDFERLEKIKKETGAALVLHGSSGTGVENIRKACSMGINKVNVCNDVLQAAYAAVKSSDLSGNEVYDFWPLISDAIREFIKKEIDMVGSRNRAWTAEKAGLPRGEVTMKED